MKVEVIGGGKERLGARAAVWVADRLWTAVAERGVAHLAVSGGSTPGPMFTALARLPVPWARVEVWQVDERVAPDGEPARNATLLLADLLGPVRLPSGQVHLMGVTADDLDAAAAEYAAALERACGGVLDVVHLGIGPDGHTASWVPGDPVVDVTDRLVASSGEYQGRRRMTLTVPAVNAGRALMLQVVGADKAAAVAGMLQGDPTLPASRLRADTVVIADAGAASATAG